jgi:hypothetical protein
MAAETRVKIFTVAPTDPYGWTIRLEASTQRPHFFASRELALNYARLGAKANRPSILQLVARDGAITREWNYITFDPLYA